MLGHQFEKLSWYVIRSRRAVRSQSFYLFKHFLMNDVTETEGGMRVICKTIDQPVDVLVEHWRRSSDTLSRRGEVPVKIVEVRTERLLAWMENTVYRPPYLLRSLRGKRSDHKRLLGLLDQVFELFRVYRNMSHAPFLGGRACASRR